MDDDAVGAAGDDAEALPIGRAGSGSGSGSRGGGATERGNRIRGHPRATDSSTFEPRHEFGTDGSGRAGVSVGADGTNPTLGGAGWWKAGQETAQDAG